LPPGTLWAAAIAIVALTLILTLATLPLILILILVMMPTMACLRNGAQHQHQATHQKYRCSNLHLRNHPSSFEPSLATSSDGWRFIVKRAY
jgi:hypothetical protein